MPAKLSLHKSAALLAALLLGACATPAQRITSNLTELGVPPRQAQCTGGRLGLSAGFVEGEILRAKVGGVEG